jgi:crotonobetainyl-CoA:carnitine CoA-transferase CaiB-like acyl-CoA transferase
MTGALDGLRVIDMTSVVMGPTATQLLGDYGAEIIKVEAPAGDTARQVTPLRHEGMGYVYLQKNRNKRSIVLDLKQADHHAALEKLLETADIFVYSARPQAMARNGLTPERFAELNQGLISVSLVGYGEGGPYSDRPAYEDLIQGLTAIPSLLTMTGSPQPQYVPVSFNDRAVGAHAVAMMMIALNHRNRTGEGQHIEVPMFETMAQFVIGDHMGGMAYLPPIAPPGYKRTLTPERRPYQTKDGYICVIVYTDSQWRAFGKLIGRPDLLDEDERFRSLGTRTSHAEAVYALVREAMLTGTTGEWLDKLNAADIPATPLHTLESIFDDPHLEATGFFEEYDHPTEGKLLMMRGPKNWSKTPPRIRRPAPRLGENTAEVLTEIGYPEEEARKIAGVHEQRPGLDTGLEAGR